MPTYLVLGNYTDQGLRNITEAPASGYRVETAVEMIGGKVVDLYLTMGQYDVAFIAEAPSDEAFASALLSITKTGDMHTTTLKAFPAEKMNRIVGDVR